VQGLEHGARVHFNAHAVGVGGESCVDDFSDDPVPRAAAAHFTDEEPMSIPSTSMKGSHQDTLNRMSTAVLIFLPPILTFENTPARNRLLLSAVLRIVSDLMALEVAGRRLTSLPLK